MTKGNKGFTLIELMIVVAILGILAVVAIPSFVRYMRMAKTAEAHRMLSKLTRMMKAYWQTPHYDSNGSPVVCIWPDANLTNGLVMAPPLGSCCTDGEADGKCEPNETYWNDTGWQALLFKISDKNYYSYDTGHLSGAPEVATDAAAGAMGDLDCDGTYSTFIQFLVGTRGPQGFLNCRASSKGSLVVFDEIE